MYLGDNVYCDYGFREPNVHTLDFCMGDNESLLSYQIEKRLKNSKGFNKKKIINAKKHSIN